MDRLAETVRDQLRQFGPQADLAGVTDRWAEAVGAAIARNAWPARLARDGTLHVNTSDSIWAFELAQQAAEIARRIGVTAIRFAPGPLAGDVQAPRPPTLPLPSAEQVREAREIAAAIGDESLRESVQKAVSLGLARGFVDHPV